ncbi:ribbon-helix-helix domain-containing protein [Sulfurimonas sp.]|uniref:ribbon-helix-helix domain-containing protein n=1 Tax=Sulfurimonas sp. TaxID=2022749 RepID=UPI00260E2979|nr:ribbon-helix-helix domain-containing protein [Sulfurimonas sp.]
MHNLSELQKQQVGLRLPKYLLDDIDEFTKAYSLNRTDIIVEAVKSYIQEQKAEIFYDSFENSAKELKSVLSSKEKQNNLQSLDELIDELEHN